MQRAAKAEMGQHYPLGRIGQPRRNWGSYCILLSNKASFVTGQHGLSMVVSLVGNIENFR